MKYYLQIIFIYLLGTSCNSKMDTEQKLHAAEKTFPCIEQGIILQVLGSGGPMAGDGRASSGYLVWADGQPLVMIDAGGGTYLRMQQAGVHMQDIRLLGISHLHPDHASDLPALIWSDILSNRPVPLNVSGPTGAGSEGIKGFLSAVSDMAAPIDAFTRLNTIEIATNKDSVFDVYSDDLIQVTAIRVNHSIKPTLAYKLTINGKSIAFGADQTLDSPGFLKFIKGVDLLVLHLAISEAATEPFTNLHAKPDVVGKVAQASGVNTLVLSHFMKLNPDHKLAGQFSLADLNSNVEMVAANFEGAIILAEDLKCIKLSAN